MLRLTFQGGHNSYLLCEHFCENGKKKGSRGTRWVFLLFMEINLKAQSWASRLLDGEGVLAGARAQNDDGRVTDDEMRELEPVLAFVPFVCPSYRL